MIISYIAEEKKQSRWHRGFAELLIYEGHADGYLLERAVQAVKADKAIVSKLDSLMIESFDAFQHEEGPEEHPVPQWLKDNIESAALSGENWYDTAMEWGVTTRLTGEVHDLWLVFYAYANQVDPMCDPADYRPGGDDDSYDYFPSAFRALQEFARNLDALDMRLAPEQRRCFAAHERLVEIVQRLKKNDSLEFSEYGDMFKDFEGAGNDA